MTPVRNSATGKADEEHSGDGDRRPGGPASLLITSPVAGSRLLDLYLGILICQAKVTAPFLFTSQCLETEEIIRTKVFVNTLPYNTAECEPSTERC